MTSSSEQTTALPQSVEALTVRWSGDRIAELWDGRSGEWLSVTPAPRVVSTVAELDALPVGSVLRFSDNGLHMTIYHRLGGGWVRDAYNGFSGPVRLPATVLWVGGTE